MEWIKIDKAKHWISYAVGRSVITEGREVIPHPDILYGVLHLFWPNGIHLPLAGLYRGLWNRREGS